MEAHSQTEDGLPEAPDEGYWDALLDSADSECEQPGGRSRIAGRGPGGTTIDWQTLQRLKDEEAVLTCCIAGYNRGGLLAENELVCGFLPVSHLLNCPPCKEEQAREEQLQAYLGRSLDVKIIECDPGRGRVVLSERAAQAIPGTRNQLFHALAPGQKCCGEVTNIKEFGVFIDLGGVEGLVHISELSWGRVSSPDQILALGESVDVQVLGLDEKRGRVSLSLKRLLPNPWEDAAARYPVGMQARGWVSEIVNFGVFVRLEDGLEGLIHNSELGIALELPGSPPIGVGDLLTVEILSVEPTRQRLSLRRIGEQV